MDYQMLGNTKLKVSRLCFGALTIGPLQANMSVAEGSAVIVEALERGVNFIDTAQLYDTYPYIKAALKQYTRNDVIIASKCYAYNREGAVASLEKARTEMNRDVIDIFLLHEQESIHTIRGHREALEYFFECKQKGIIKAVGISTHNISGVLGAADTKLDVIHPIVNYKGLGIVDGSIEEMLCAVRTAYEMGIGIYAMKPLGGGNLLNNFHKSMDFVFGLDFVHSVAVGMRSVAEVEYNINYMNGIRVPFEFCAEKKLHIDSWCEGCGQCIPLCSQKALSVQDGRLCVDRQRCVLCGYCGSACKNFAIKIA